MDKIKEVQGYISEALENWSIIMLDMDANGMTFCMHYSERDLLNAIYMFNHVVSNIGIHKGIITVKNADEMGGYIREFIKKYTDIDTREITRKALKNS